MDSGDSESTLKRIKKEIVPSKKRVQAKGWFLTYPRCDAPMEVVMAFLKGHPNYDSSIVAQELHQDGARHIHCFVKYRVRKEFTPVAWDFYYDEVLYHGNYQSAKSFRAVENYCKKEGNFIVDNVNCQEFVKKYRSSELLKMDIHYVFENDILGFRDYKKLVEAQNLHALFNLKSYEAFSVRGIWIYGPPGTGKSLYARDFLRKNCESYYVKSQNKWWDGYRGEHGVLMDDVDSDALGHYLKIWTDRYSCVGEVKGSCVLLQHRYFVITSNLQPEDIWYGTPSKDSMAVAIRRRCYFVSVLNKGHYDWETYPDTEPISNFVETNKPSFFK